MSQNAADVVCELVNQWNRHEAARAASLLAEDVEYWDVTQPKAFQGRIEVREFFESFFGAFPDLNFVILSLFAAGERVACEWQMRGTQEKELQGINALGKSIDITGASICTVRDGKIVRQVDYWDSGTMMRQLGLST